MGAAAPWGERYDAPSHPLARLPKPSLADIAAHPAVLPDPGTFTHRIVAETFARRGLSLQLRMTTNYLETIKMMVSVGLAWSALPQTMVDAQVVVLPVPGVQLSRRLGYVTHGGRTLSRAAHAFIALLQSDATPATNTTTSIRMMNGAFRIAISVPR